MPNEIGRIMLIHGHAKIENGYCVLPNGPCLIQMKTRNIFRCSVTCAKHPPAVNCVSAIGLDSVSVLEKARLMMQHCMHEYTNENRLLDAFWESLNEGENYV